MDFQHKVQASKVKSSFSLYCVLKLSKAQLNTKACRVTDPNFLHYFDHHLQQIVLLTNFLVEFFYSYFCVLVTEMLIQVSSLYLVFIQQWSLLKVSFLLLCCHKFIFYDRGYVFAKSGNRNLRCIQQCSGYE